MVYYLVSSWFRASVGHRVRESDIARIRIMASFRVSFRFRLGTETTLGLGIEIC